MLSCICCACTQQQSALGQRNLSNSLAKDPPPKCRQLCHPNDLCHNAGVGFPVCCFLLLLHAPPWGRGLSLAG